MNIHHLELFYHVARHGGISRAVRHIPYGIQQPAVSGQILQLEKDLGVKLFERQPFKLTREGAELEKFVRPFFENLPAVRERVRGGAARQLRLGTSELVLRDYFPNVMRTLQRQHPGLKFSLRSGFQPELELWLREREIDFSINPFEGRPPRGLRRLRLLRVPLVLLVPRRSPIRTAADLRVRNLAAEPLINLPDNEPVARTFQQNLRRFRLRWPTTIEASSLELVTQYVAQGYGAGVNVNLPGMVNHPEVRAVPLPDFTPLEVGMMWRGAMTPLLRVIAVEAQRYIAATWPTWACREKLP